MNFVRFSSGKSDEMKGVLDKGVVRQIYGSYLQVFTYTENVFSPNEITFLPPVIPQNIICVNADGKGYAKAPASLCGSGTVIRLPEGTEYIYCMPRICCVVKDRNINKNTGITLFGITYMLDFSFSQNGGGLSSNNNKHSVLGLTVDTNLQSIPNFDPKPALKTMAENIQLYPGDVIAFAAQTKPSQYKRGDKAAFAGKIEAYIE